MILILDKLFFICNNGRIVGGFMNIFSLNFATAADTINSIYTLFIFILGVLTAYKVIYIIVGFFPAKKFPKSEKIHNYAFMIAARNEEKVIGNLIDSIKAQNYPHDKITIFIVADNCTDSTAELCRQKNCIVYERFNKEQIGKGFALKFLTEHIINDYGMNSFDGFFVFDADNLLSLDYVTKMNDAFSAGAQIITSYRNIKNFGTNWISGSYGYHQLRNIRALHIPRSKLNMSCTVTGTGFLVNSQIIKDGWKWENITEDAEFSIDSIARGYQITYCNDAVFYDEQPTKIHTMFRQRLRWAKGGMLVFGSYFFTLLKQLFKKRKNLEGQATNNQNAFQRRFTTYDMFFQVFPYAVIVFFAQALYYIALLIVLLAAKASVGDFLLTMLTAILTSKLTIYLSSLIQLLPVVFIEWKRIVCHPVKKVFYIFVFPVFDLLNIYIMLTALFIHVEWKPIVHNESISINELMQDDYKFNKATKTVKEAKQKIKIK